MRTSYSLAHHALAAALALAGLLAQATPATGPAQATAAGRTGGSGASADAIAQALHGSDEGASLRYRGVSLLADAAVSPGDGLTELAQAGPARVRCRWICTPGYGCSYFCFPE